jgi:hypothetical protein
VNRIAALSLACIASLFAAWQNSQPAPQVAPPPPPPPTAPVVVAAPAMPPSLATSLSTVPGSRTVTEAFGDSKHLVVEVSQFKPGKQEISSKSFDDQIPAVLAALGADRRSVPVMPRCLTPLTFTFTDANNVRLCSEISAVEQRLLKVAGRGPRGSGDSCQARTHAEERAEWT